jgi:hypothetical protein
MTASPGHGRASLLAARQQQVVSGSDRALTGCGSVPSGGACPGQAGLPLLGRGPVRQRRARRCWVWQGTNRHGETWRRPAGLGTASLCEAAQDLAWPGSTWRGEFRRVHGRAPQGAVWLGPAGPGSGMARRGRSAAWRGQASHGGARPRFGIAGSVRSRRGAAARGSACPGSPIRGRAVQGQDRPGRGGMGSARLGQACLGEAGP